MDIEDNLLNEMIETEKEIIEKVGNELIFQISENEIVEKIPLLKNICEVYKFGKSLTELIFIKKLCKFIVNLSNATEEEKRKFFKRYKEDDEKFLETLLEIIDNLDDDEKCKWEGKIFEGYFYGKIDYKIFKRYSNALQKLYVEDIKLGYEYFKNSTPNEDGYIIFKNGFGSQFLMTGFASIVTYVGTCPCAMNEEGMNFFKILFE